MIVTITEREAGLEKDVKMLAKILRETSQCLIDTTKERDALKASNLKFALSIIGLVNESGAFKKLAKVDEINEALEPHYAALDLILPDGGCLEDDLILALKGES